MKKTVIICKDTPGFIVNRLLVPYLLEAIEMWERGEASLETIDAAMRLGAGHPMGPFEMYDLVGLDGRLRIQTYLAETLGERFRPSPLLVNYVKAGRLGRKTGRGIYDYTEKKA